MSGMPENDKFLEVSDYEDMADLLLISDMLITDYSSSIGDFVLLNKPAILFQSDREEYENKDREFAFNMEEGPFWIVQTQAELENKICGISESDVKKNCQEILEFYGAHETGHASDAVARIISKHLPERADS